tara:strand:+ start:958 stop:1569 length:612 start_codon:yes stop_codon:yes gene_type:complete
MSDSFNRAWDVVKMPPNMFGDEPGPDNNPMQGDVLHPWTNRLQGMEPEMLSMLLNAKRGERPPEMDQIYPPDGGGSIDDAMRSMMTFPSEMREPPKDHMRSPMEIAEEQEKRMMEKPYETPEDRHGGFNPNKATGKPMREKSPKDYGKKRDEEKRRTASGDRKGKSPDKKDPAKKPKLGQGLVDRAKKNTHTMPGSSDYKKPE